ncbi:MAG: terminase large subunit [Dechloromonas sp.]|nr:terminase large subunit [Dechloromonas sp.]
MADWSTACPDWERRLLAGQSLVPNLPLFTEEADRAERVFKRLRIPDLIGTPTMGEVAGPWLFPIVRAIFGSYDVDTNRRMIQEFFWLIAKKNTKTSSGAAIMVEALILNRRPEGEFNLVSATKEIADISFRQASGTIRTDPELDKTFQVQKHIRTITHRRTGATLKVKAADTDVITGGKGSTLIDELHVLGSKKDAADILVEIRGALAARPDGFLIIITTQSKAPPEGVFKSELGKARLVRDGKLSLPLLPILYELPGRLQDGDGWKDRRYWSAVNPNLGRSVDEAFLERSLLTAEIEGKEELALFASQHFNVEIGLKMRSDRWAGTDYWEKAVEPAVTLKRILECCEVITIGIDGGGLDDLLSLYVIGREATPNKDVRFRRWFGWGHSWAFSDPVNKGGVLERRKSEVAKLRDFEAVGELTIFTRMGDDIEEMVAIIKTVFDSGKLAMIGLDPVGVGAVVDAIADAEIRSDGDEEMIVAVSQGYKLMGAIKTAERKLADGTLVPAEQAIMAWAVGNARNEQKGNAMMITKQASGTAKIDPLMAMFDAIALMSTNPEASDAIPDDYELAVWA